MNEQRRHFRWLDEQAALQRKQLEDLHREVTAKRPQQKIWPLLVNAYDGKLGARFRSPEGDGFYKVVGLWPAIHLPNHNPPMAHPALIRYPDGSVRPLFLPKPGFGFAYIPT